MDTEIRFAVYCFFGFWAFSHVVDFAKTVVSMGAPKVATPLMFISLSLTVMCVALAVAQGFQLWALNDYFRVVNYIRWTLVISIGLSLVTLSYWRFRK